jgi:hypothetical protein
MPGASVSWRPDAQEVQMSAPEGIGDLASVIPNLAVKVDEIKKQGRVRQAFGAAVLFGSAALAIWVSPTAAIVVAALSIAGVWLFPSLRIRLIGDSIALRDADGNVRIVLGVHDDRAALALGDANGEVRLWLAVGEEGSSVVLRDERGENRVIAGCSSDSAGLMVTDRSGTHPGTLGVGQEGSVALVLDGDGARNIVSEFGLRATRGDDQAVNVMTSDAGAIVTCTCGANDVSCVATANESALMVVTDGEHALAASAADLWVDGETPWTTVEPPPTGSSVST